MSCGVIPVEIMYYTLMQFNEPCIGTTCVTGFLSIS